MSGIGTPRPSSRNRYRRAAGAIATVVIALGATTAVTAAQAHAAGISYVTAVPVCKAPKKVHFARCDSWRRIVSKTKTAGARPMTTPATWPTGPAGGYTPADLSTAYGYIPTAAMGSGKIVAIVDAFNDPNILADLNTFNAQYGFGLRPHRRSRL